jgi:hypothetical protein
MKASVDQDHIKSGEETGKSVSSLKAEIELKQKTLSDKIDETNKAN